MAVEMYFIVTSVFEVIQDIQEEKCLSPKVYFHAHLLKDWVVKNQD